MRSARARLPSSHAHEDRSISPPGAQAGPAPPHRRPDFAHWFESACQFYHDFEADLNREWLNKAAFELHQATERYYTAFLLVLTGYKPKTHDIGKLGQLAAAQDTRVLHVFPRSTPEERARFDLLKRAYVDARYRRDYAITRADLEYLSARVRELKALTDGSCRGRIEEMGG